MKLKIIGVRHHSPACARLVVHAIKTLKPAFVLIEGPADFNGRMDELFLSHHLPIALYSYLSHRRGHRGSWTPFAEHSPEWQALQAGRKAGASLLFMDLPSWSNAFAHLENRYADALDEETEAQIGQYDKALAARLCIEGKDALWDQLFENLDADEEDPDLLDAALHAYFENLRGDTPGSLGNQAREQMMAAWIAWAVEQKKGPVLAVCGGYHAPMLARLWPSFSGEKPALPLPGDEVAASHEEGGEEADQTVIDKELRFGAYLVPYSFKKLDAFSGYASGMPSPGYYQWVWESNHKKNELGTRLLKAVIERLRSKNLMASTADLISVHAHAYALARLRSHRYPLRVDWLDALAGALVKDALSVPLPWTYRGTLRAGTDPILVEIMDVVAGYQEGSLAPGTPQPPLVQSVKDELASCGISEKGDCKLDLLTDQGRFRSRLLHRLMILELPGIKRLRGPTLAMSGDGLEHWHLQTGLEYQAALIEAGAWGATLFDASRACLEAKLRKTGTDVGKLAQVLNQAAFAGLNSVGETCLEALQSGIGEAQHFDVIGQVLSITHTLFRYGQRLDMAGIPLLSVIIEAAFDRGLWLFELPGQVVAGKTDTYLSGVQVMTRIVADIKAARRQQDESCLSEIVPERFIAVLQRKITQADAAPLSRGAALGGLLVLDENMQQDASAKPENNEASWCARALATLDSLSATQLGDALSGIVALAREVLPYEKAFIHGLDQTIRALDDADFVQALPALRAAFGWLPTRERGQLAEQVLQIHQADHLSGRVLTAKLGDVSVEMQAASTLLEKKAMARLAHWGIILNGEFS